MTQPTVKFVSMKETQNIFTMIDEDCTKLLTQHTKSSHSIPKYTYIWREGGGRSETEKSLKLLILLVCEKESIGT